MSEYKNGDAVLETCYFCGMSFDDPQKIGTTIHCPPDLGCGTTYIIKIAPLSPPKKAKEQDEG